MFEIVDLDSIKIDNKIIKLPCSIGGYSSGKPRVFEYQGLIIVNFYPQSLEESYRNKELGVDTARNIWAFDQKGNMLWQVASLGTKFPKLHTTYTYVSIKDGKLIGGNWAGYDVEINPKDGSIKLYPENPGRSW